MSNFILSSHNPNYRTPDLFISELSKEFPFNDDPCPLNPTPTIDGLGRDWGTITFVNPPYSGVTPWIVKAIEESKKGKLIVMLLRGDTSTKWFHDLVIPNASDIRFVKGRLKFGDTGKPAPFPSIIVVFGGNAEKAR